MAEIKTNRNCDWLSGGAETDHDRSLGGLVHAQTSPHRRESNESTRLCLAKFLELSRREMNETLEGLAAEAGVDLAELTELECGKGPVRNPKLLLKIAVTLRVDAPSLLELAGLIRTTDRRLADLAVRFSARLESAKPLEPEEEAALGWFRSQAFGTRGKAAMTE